MTNAERTFLFQLCRGDFKSSVKLYHAAKEGRQAAKLEAVGSTLFARMHRDPLRDIDLNVAQIQDVYENHTQLTALGNSGAFEFWLRLFGRHDLAAAFPEIEAAAQVDGSLRW